MIGLGRPRSDEIARFLAGERDRGFSYEAVGASRDNGAPAGFVVDHNRQRLGRGAEAFASARAQLAAWRMFPAWTAIEPATPIEPGRELAVLVHALGLWFTNSARIVYVIDEPRRFGFAYGTLPAHAESGEERFLVEHLADDEVYYDLRAFSRPRFWGARLAYPITRALQRRFARDSKAAMLRALR